MKIAISLLVALATGLGFAAPARAQSAQASIEAALVEFAKAFNGKDAAAVAAQYTEDAALLPPDAARVDGRANIEKFWKGAMDAGLTDLALKAVEVEESGDLAYEVGTVTFKMPGEGGALTEAAGKYIVVWKKGPDGSWRLHRDIWNSDPAKAAQ